MLVVVHGSARQRRHRLALRAADHHADLVRRQVANLRGMNQQSLGNVDVAKVLRDLGRLHHRAAHQRHLAAVLKGHLQRQLDAMDRRREARDKQPLFGAGENLLEAGANGAFTGRVALALDIGRVLEERQHTFFAVFGEGVQIEEPVVGRRRVDLEVSGVDQDAERRVNGQRHAIHQAVRDLNRTNGEGADLEAVTGANLVEHGVVQQRVFFELAFDQGQRELGAIDRNVELRQHPGQPADVIFVSVRQDDRAHVRPILDEVGYVGYDDIDAEQFGFREHEPGIDDDDVVAPANRHAIHAEFAESTEGNNLELSNRHQVLRC